MARFAAPSSATPPASPRRRGRRSPRGGGEGTGLDAATLHGVVEALEMALEPPALPLPAVWPALAGPGGGCGQGQPWGPERCWDLLPVSGELAWGEDGPQAQLLRLHVARMQEALSRATAGLQEALDACDECEVEGQRCEEELETEDLEEIEAETAAMLAEARRLRGEEGAGRGAGRGSPARGEDQNEEEEEAAMLAMLSCFKDVALAHRAEILPARAADMTPEQQVVACFLDEVEVIKAERSLA